jgi:hypothetical protein
VTLGGPVVKSPKIVPIVWTTDDLAADIDTWLAASAKTTYWGDQVAEYGVGRPTFGATVHVSDALPQTLSDGELKAWLVSKLDGTHPEFPVPDANTFFLLVYPAGTTITLPLMEGGGASCSAFHGFHSETAPIASGLKIPYAVVSRCASIPEAPVTGIQYVAAVASHEVLEGLADPFVFTDGAYQLVDDAHAGWAAVMTGEIGDLCALQGNAFYQPPDFPYTVQKMWSNAAASAGKDPCIPEMNGDPYIMGIPQLDAHGAVKIAVGAEAKVPVYVYADTPTDAPVTLQAHGLKGMGTLALTLDRATAKPGETVTLTVKSVAVGPTGEEPFAILATTGSRTNMFFGVVTH